jgi:choline kinase
MPIFMSMMQRKLPREAVILVAGRGVRMGSKGSEQPKGLLSVGGAPLVEQSIRRMRHFGVERFLIVTGHLAEQYEEAARTWGDDVRCILNHDYAAAGSGLSAIVGLEATEGATLLLEGDIIYDCGGLASLADAEGESAVLCSGFTGAGDEAWAWGRWSEQGAALFDDIAKTLDHRPDAPWGEQIGIMTLGEGYKKALMATMREAVARQPMVEYWHCLTAAADTQHPLHLCLDRHFIWAEVDDFDMLERARTMVAPLIVEREKTLDARLSRQKEGADLIEKLSPGKA